MPSPLPPRLDLVRPPERVVYGAFLLTACHDDYKPALAPHVAAMSIGAALLAELVATEHLNVAASAGVDWVTPHRSAPPPGESIGLWLMEILRGEPKPLHVREWLAYLGSGEADLYERVAARMVTDRHLQRVTATRRWRRTSVTYQPVDSMVVQGLWTLLRRPLQPAGATEPLSSRRAFLLGLTESAGLGTHLFHGIDDAGRTRAREAITALPMPLRTLLGHLGTAVADTAMTGTH